MRGQTGRDSHCEYMEQHRRLVLSCRNIRLRRYGKGTRTGTGQQKDGNESAGGKRTVGTGQYKGVWMNPGRGRRVSGGRGIGVLTSKYLKTRLQTRVVGVGISDGINNNNRQILSL